MSNPTTHAEFTRLRHFRQQVYQLLGQRKDAFFELMDAVVQTPSANSFAELSLAAACTRQWHSLYKALAEVTYNQQELDCLCVEAVPDEHVAHFAIDVTNVRRMHSPTLKERRYCHGAQREVNGRGIIIGLPYSIVAWSSARGSSFAPAVHIRRLNPEEKAVAVAVEQLLWLGLYTPSTLEWRAALDGAYGNREFFARLRDKEVQVVARTRCDRVLYRRANPADYGGKGRRAVFGTAFRCHDEATWGAADQDVSLTDAQHGHVRLQVWHGLGFRHQGQFVAVSVLRSQIHLERAKPPPERWYIAYNGKREQTVCARQWYETITHRWAIEPANRFRKERLYALVAKSARGNQ